MSPLTIFLLISLLKRWALKPVLINRLNSHTPSASNPKSSSFFLLTSQFVFISFMNTSHNKKFCRRIARKYKKKIKGRLTQYVSEHDEILNRWKNKLGHFSFSIHTSRAVSSSRTSLLIIDFIDLRKNKHEEPPSDDILF